MYNTSLKAGSQQHGLSSVLPIDAVRAGLRMLLVGIVFVLALVSARAADVNAPNPNAPIMLTGTIHVLPLGCGNPNYKGPSSALILVDEKTYEITELKGDVVDFSKIKLGSRVTVQGTLQAFDAQEGPRVLTFSAVDSAGALEEQQAVAAEAQNASDPVVAAAPTLTNLKCLLIFANTNDYTVPSSKVTSAKNVLFNNSSNAANGMEHATYGHYKIIHGDTVTVTLNVTANGMSYSTMWTNMKNAASAAGYNLNNYDRVLCFAPNGVNFNGGVAYGYMPGKDTIYASNATGTSMDIHLHELGHNFGFAHAGTGTNQYGDEYLAMGISHLNTGRTETYGAVKKLQAGWFNPFSGTQATLTTDATFDLYPVSQNPGSVPGMRIVRISGTNYYISYMKRGGSYEYMNATHAVTVHTHSSGSTSWRQSAMQSAGNQYTAGTTKVRVERFGPNNSYATVSFDLDDGNTKPVANGQSVSLKQNTSKAITLTGSDADGDTLTFATVTNPANGALSGTAPNLIYTPTANYTGADSFVFKVNDGKISSFATVTINVVANSAPVANNQLVFTAVNTPLAITLTATDANGDPLTYTVLTSPAQGALTGSAPNLTFTPTNGYTGSDSFTFKANDGAVDSNIATISIKIGNIAPTSNAGPDQSVTLSSGTWSPTAVATAAWYDASDTGTITHSGGAVSQLRDKSGNNRHVSGGTSKPITGTRTMNGLNVLDFDNNDYLDNSANITAQAYSFAVVASVDNSGQDNTLFDANGAQRSLVRRQSTNTLGMYAGAWGSNVTGPTTGSFLVSGAFNGASSQIRANGGAAVTGNPGSGNLTEGITIGNNATPSTTYDHDGTIGEILISSGVWSATDREKIEGYLAHKWGLSANLPASHPYKAIAPVISSAVATLDGTAADVDGDTLTYTWTVVSGTGSVVFANAMAIDTTATFTVAGTYTLRLTVSDGFAQTTDDVVITVNGPSSTPSVTFTAASQASVSESGTLTVTAQLSATSAQNVTVPFTVSGSATSGTDCTITVSPITITAGATTGTATITIISDTVDEPNETVVLTMGTPTNATKGATTVHTATITDDDATPTVTFTAAGQASVSESGTLVVTAQLSNASSQAVTVPFTVSGSASSGADYTITASPITIAAGATSGTATIMIISDTVDEPNETVVLTMGTPTNATKGATTAHTATITDDDATPTVIFTAASQASANESGTLLVTAQLSNASSQSITVPFTVSGSATAGTDYTITASPITIAAGALTGTATITIVTDTIDEPNETVILTMGTPTNATKGATTVHTATITDDDATPTVTFAAASQASANESGTMTVTAQLSGASSQNVSVPFTVTGTATSGTDYTITASPIVITAGATTGSATITIVTDTDIEGNETVILTMGTPTNAAKGATTVHTATITDDDGTGTPSVTWTQASQSSPGESGTMTVTAQLSAASAQNITVPFTVSGTATSGTDYTITASPISIAAGATSGTATISIITDTIDEPNETVVLTMGAPTNATAGATTVHTATITDDDATPTVTWAAASQASANESGTMTVTAQLSNASSQSVTVPFTVSGTATLVSDYTITASPITIAAGATSGAATITIVGDTAIEGNETVVLTMGTPTNATKGATSVHTATITDDDGTGTPSVAWTVSGQSSAGESGTLTVTAQLSAASAQNITVPFTVNGTATSGADYTITAIPITITSGATTGTATITIITDTIDEPNETVILTMGTPTNATKGATTVHTATITDDDAQPTVTWIAASQASVNESGTMTVTAQLSNTSSQSVTVPFAITGTASLGADYTITASPITIAAGATSGSATISIISDAIDEPNETVVLTMGTPTNATKGATTSHTATIIDDDAMPTVTWATASQASANESGTMTVTAQLSAVSGQTVSVPFAVSGTATLGADYTITASPITIAAGATSGIATITIINDSIIEGNETVILTMGTPTNATKGATTVHTATITDDDVEPTVTIIATDPDANETPGDPGVFTVQLSAAAANDVTVNYVVSGSAISDTDYLSVGTSVIISAGQLGATVMIEPIDDSKVEKPETVILTLAAGAGYQISTPDSDTVTIADDDKNDPKGNPNASGIFEDGSSTSSKCGVGSGISTFLLSLFFVLMARLASQQWLPIARRKQ